MLFIMIYWSLLFAQSIHKIRKVSSKRSLVLGVSVHVLARAASEGVGEDQVRGERVELASEYAEVPDSVQDHVLRVLGKVVFEPIFLVRESERLSTSEESAQGVASERRRDHVLRAEPAIFELSLLYDPDVGARRHAAGRVRLLGVLSFPAPVTF